MKKIILFLLHIIPQLCFGQITINPNISLDKAIDDIWAPTTPRSTANIQNVGPESLGKNEIIAPILPPARTRTVIPGRNVELLPMEQTDGPLNLSPNDTKAYIIYNRATISYRKKEFEKARELYRDLIRRYPDSSYTPYALYTLSLSEKDYRRKIRFLLTIKERFPNFSHQDIILDRLGDIYYLLDSPDAAEEILAQSKSAYALYMRAVIALDSQKPNQAIKLIRLFLKTMPDNESAYTAYMIYAEALLLLKKYSDVLVILEKAAPLRAWAYDNGTLILLNAGKTFFSNKQYEEALYAFSLLRLRFSRSTESRLADQFIVALSKKNVVNMKTVPWIAKNFETIIQEQPVVNFKKPKYPTAQDVMKMNPYLPRTAVSEPSLDKVGYLPPMPLPTPIRNAQSILVPIDNGSSLGIDIVTVTNTVFQTVTNEIEQVMTNRVEDIQMNLSTNINPVVKQIYITNTKTNVIQVYETNTVLNYEPIVIWKTNYRNINTTNLFTNIVDQIITNTRLEVLPLWKTNYNLIERTNDVTNIINKVITNTFVEIIPTWKTNGETITRTNDITNIINKIITNSYTEVIPRWKTSYRTVDQTNLTTNIVNEVVTNTRLEVLPRWITNNKTITQTNNITNIINSVVTNTRLEVLPQWITNNKTITRTNDVTNIIDSVITNTRLEVLPRWVTNNKIITRTNDVTNIINSVVTNTRLEVLPRWITNNRTITRTNDITNIINEVVTNIGLEVLPLWITNNKTVTRTNDVTNIINSVVTNTRLEVLPRWITNNKIITRTNDVTNIINSIVTNTRLEVLPRWITNNQVITRTTDVTNIINSIITNTRLEVLPLWKTNIKTLILTNTSTNKIDVFATNALVEIVSQWQTNYLPVYITNFTTNMITMMVTNSLNELVPKRKTQLIPYVQTNYTPQIVEKEITNVREIFTTNVVDMLVTNIDRQLTTNVVDLVVTNIVNIVETNKFDQIITNLMHTTNTVVLTNQFLTTNRNGIQTNTVIVSNTKSYAEPAPIRAEDIPIIIDAPQEEYIKEPIYEKPIEEPQALYLTDDVARLENKASRAAEQAAGAAGKYSFPDNKGFVVRVAQLKDLSVANIVTRDINKLNKDIPVGIYYRDQMYYVEIRNLRDYETAKKLSQDLYKLGYVDIQVFEQFEVIEYEE